VRQWLLGYAFGLLFPDFELTYLIFKKYDFDEETTLRYALDLIAEGRV